MSSFPTYALRQNELRIRFEEEYASEGLGIRFMGLPLGVSEGFLPSFSGAALTLSVGARGFSLAATKSGIENASVAFFRASDLVLDFTGHDFGASGDVYVYLQISYSLGSKTSGSVRTSMVAPVGNHQIGLCRVSGAGVGVITGVFFSDVPDRHTNLADGSNSFGFMPQNSVQKLETAFENVGKQPLDSTVRTAGFALTSGDMNKMFLLNMGSIVADQTISLPQISTVEDGDCVSFLSLTGLPSGFTLFFTSVAGDNVEYQGGFIPGPTPIPQHRKTIAHCWTLKAIKQGPNAPCWFLTEDKMPRFHAALHGPTGADPLKLDDLAEPDDTTDLDSSAARHGLLPKLSGNASEVLRGDGSFGAAPPSTMGYTYHVTTLVASTTLVADGRIYRYDATTPFPVSLPDGNVLAEGVVVRLQSVGNGSLTINRSVDNLIRMNENSVGVVSVVSPSVPNDFLEFVLDNSGGVPEWVRTVSGRKPRHADTHASGGSDPLSISSLGGLSGSISDIVRGDGSTDGESPYFHAHSTTGVGPPPNAPVSGSPVHWNGPSPLNAGYTFHGAVAPFKSDIQVPTDGVYAIFVDAQGDATGTVMVTLKVGGVTVKSHTVNVGAGSATTMMLAIVSISGVLSTKRVSVDASNLGGTDVDTTLSIVRLRRF